MMKIEEIKAENEGVNAPESEIKVKKEEIKLEDPILKMEVTVSEQEQQCVPETTGIMDAKSFDLVKFEITELEDESAENAGEGSSNSKADGFNCIYCEQVFQSRKFYLNHLRRGHRGFPREYTGGLIQCQFCEHAYQEVHTLKQHVKANHAVPLKIECALCRFKCKWLNGIKAHMNSHLPARPYRCKLCPQAFKIKGSLNYHMKRVHKQSIFIQCSRCPDRLKSLKELKDHMITVHYKGGHFQCRKCGITLESESKYTYHMATEHRSEKIRCSICSKDFKEKYFLKEHMRVHSDERTFKCHLCPKSYKQKLTLDRHLLLHGIGNQNKLHTCDVCSKIFSASSEFKRHLKYHKRANLKRELLLDLYGEKNACPMCEKVFPNEGSLMKHKNLHNRPSLECHLCTLTYIVKKSFLNHLISIHKMTKEAAAESLKQQISRHQEGTSSKADMELKEELEESLKSVIVKTEYQVT